MHAPMIQMTSPHLKLAVGQASHENQQNDSHAAILRQHRNTSLLVVQ
jgi:hypothetical protein